METNTDKQNELMNAVVAGAPALYCGSEADAPLTAGGTQAMLTLGTGVDDAKAAEAAREMTQKAISHVTQCVWLGLLCQAKKEVLDAQGSNQHASKGEGFEGWAARVLGGIVSMRTMYRYMKLARSFLFDAEDALGTVPEGEEALLKVLGAWCGERTLAQITADIRKEAHQKELKASEDEAPQEEAQPEPTQADRMAAVLEKLDKVLDRSREYDEEIKNIFATSGADLTNEATTVRLEALANHHAELRDFYAGLFAKAKSFGERAGNTHG
jgi:hypothetical protein